MAVVKGGFVVLVFFLTCWFVTAKEMYTITTIGTICQILDPAYVAKYTCRSKNLNRTFNIQSREIIYQPGVNLTNVGIKVQVYRKFGTVYRPFLVTLDVDLCAALRGDNPVLFKILDIEEHRKFGNLYDPCPISGRRYERRPFEYETFPEILPGGEYRQEMIFYAREKGEKKNMARVVFLGSITPKTAEQWRK